MKNKLSFYVACSAAILSLSSHAGFISNKSSWDSLSDSQKQAYVMGLVDFDTTFFTTDDAKEVDRKDQTLNCLIDGGISSRMIADAMDQQYMKDQSSWIHPPFGSYRRAINDICSFYFKK